MKCSFINLNSIVCMIPYFRVVFVCLFVALSLPLNGKKSDTLKPEYHELLIIVDAEKTLLERMKSDLSEEKLNAEIAMRAESIEKSYHAYLEDYPSSVFAKILFGKFLRKIDKTEDADDLFLDIHEDNPDIAVVNQQLALYASEKGKFVNAYKFFTVAISLEPETALFHYQKGEFLYTYKIPLIKQLVLSISEVERQMNLAFETAHKLAPDNRDFHLRWAESFFDVFNPDWTTILPIWDELLESTSNLFERDVLRLQKARVLIKLSRYMEARNLVESVNDSALNDSKKKLLELLP